MKKFSLWAALALLFTSFHLAACEVPYDTASQIIVNDVKIYASDVDNDGRYNYEQVLAECQLAPTQEQRAACVTSVTSGEAFGSTTSGLIGGDCDSSRADVYGEWTHPTTGQVFPGHPELCDNIDNDCDGLVDEGLIGTQANCATNEVCQPTTGGNACVPVSCDDGNVCTSGDSMVNSQCMGMPIAGCCTSDSQCSGSEPYCTSHNPATAGICVECKTDSHCSVSDFCQVSTHTCEPLNCQPHNVCDSVQPRVNTQGQHYCDHDPIVGCCLTNSDCGNQEICQQNSCIPTSCPADNDGDECTDNMWNGTQCVHARYTNCATHDHECRPQGTGIPPVSGYTPPAGCDMSLYIVGASIRRNHQVCKTVGTQTHCKQWSKCTTGWDPDRDGRLPNQEMCQNPSATGYDDDGDGDIDEGCGTTPSPPPVNPCRANQLGAFMHTTATDSQGNPMWVIRGATGLSNVTSGTAVNVNYVGTSSAAWIHNGNPTELRVQVQPGNRTGDMCSTGQWYWPDVPQNMLTQFGLTAPWWQSAASGGMMDSAKLAWCRSHTSCEDYRGNVSLMPRLTSTGIRACECPFDLAQSGS